MYIAGAILGSGIIYHVGDRIYNSYKEKKEISRRKTECEKLPSGDIKEIVKKMIDMIPISKYGKKVFDKLILCKSEKDINEWAGIYVATSSWSATTLMNIEYVLRIKNVVSDILHEKVERAWNLELKEIGRKGKQCWTNHVRLVYDLKNGFQPQFVF